MKKIREILERKIKFLAYNRNNYFTLEQELIDFVFETPELVELLRKIIVKNKISRDWLQDIFNTYIVLNLARSKNEEMVTPLFWDKEIEQDFGLLKSLKDLLTSELEEIKNRQVHYEERTTDDLFEDPTRERYYNLKKLYHDITQEIDLIEARKGKDFSLKNPNRVDFNKQKGTLEFAGQEIKISKSGKKTDAVLLLETLFKVEGDSWKHNDEILSDWGYNDDDQKDVPKNKVYFAGQKINNEIARKTKITDFIECNTSKARINPKYKKMPSL